MARRKQAEPEPAPREADPEEVSTGPGIFYRPTAAAGEQRAAEMFRGGFKDTWQYAVYQVNSRQGGYVEERDAEGKVLRRPPAGA